MAEHELDFTDADRVEVTMGIGRIAVTARRGGDVDRVVVDLPTGPAVRWLDERDVLGGGSD